jgi:hypothetical protein
VEQYAGRLKHCETKAPSLFTLLARMDYSPVEQSHA